MLDKLLLNCQLPCKLISMYSNGRHVLRWLLEHRAPVSAVLLERLWGRLRVSGHTLQVFCRQAMKRRALRPAFEFCDTFDDGSERPAVSSPCGHPLFLSIHECRCRSDCVCRRGLVLSGYDYGTVAASAFSSTELNGVDAVTPSPFGSCTRNGEPMCVNVDSQHVLNPGVGGSPTGSNLLERSNQSFFKQDRGTRASPFRDFARNRHHSDRNGAYQSDPDTQLLATCYLPWSASNKGGVGHANLDPMGLLLHAMNQHLDLSWDTTELRLQHQQKLDLLSREECYDLVTFRVQVRGTDPTSSQSAAATSCSNSETFFFAHRSLLMARSEYFRALFARCPVGKGPRWQTRRDGMWHFNT